MSILHFEGDSHNLQLKLNPVVPVHILDWLTQKNVSNLTVRFGFWSPFS